MSQLIKALKVIMKPNIKSYTILILAYSIFFVSQSSKTEILGLYISSMNCQN